MKLLYKGLLVSICIFNSNTIFSQSVTPVVNNNFCQFTVGNVFFEAAALQGARISSFKIDDTEIIYNNQTNGASTWGSVMWSSPQSEWNWPPIETLDSKPYTFEVQDNRCRMTSEVSTKLKMRFVKDYYAASEDTSITIVYKIVNEGTATKHNAVWEITRVLTAGLFFYPTGEGSATNGLSEYVQEINGYSWYQNQVSDNGQQKFFADGSLGWYAHVTADRNIFIKQFVDVPNASHAPGENEIELWLNGDKAYIEMENQSAYEDIPVGDSLKYVVKWYLRKLPDTLSVEAGNLALVDFVTKTIGDAVSDPDTSTNIGTKISMTKSTANVRLSPNPAYDYIQIIDDSKRVYYVEVFNISGQLLFAQTAKSNDSINISHLNKGAYLIKLKTDDKISTLNFIKQ